MFGYWSPFSEYFLGLGALPAVAPPGMLPPATLDGRMELLGDINGDGYDDHLVNAMSQWPSNQPIRVLYDGATHAPVWMDSLPVTNGIGAGLGNVSSPRFSDDIDGDGVHDVFTTYLSGFNVPSWEIRARSGANGQLIWEYSDYAGQWVTATAVARVSDLNSDGIGDLVLRLQYAWLGTTPVDFHGYVRALDGATGAVLWDVPASQLSPGYPNSPYVVTIKGYPQSVADVDGDGVQDLSFLLMAQAPHQYEFGILSGADGSLIDIQHFSLDWLWPTTFLGGPGVRKPIGDVDRDGFAEYLGGILDQGPMNPAPGGTLAIIGVRTLKLPAQVQPGSLLDAELWIPAAPNMPYRILFSKTFEPYQDSVVVGTGFDTHLVADALLHASSSHPALAGVLDAQGRASKSIWIPTSLAGEDIYAAAVIFDPSFEGGVQTISSTSRFSVLP